jgi:hypothetical protein
MLAKSVRRFISDTQVAGHAGAFISEKDKLLKLISFNEKSFYDRVFHEAAPIELQTLRKFMPEYYGTVILYEVLCIQNEYIVLENLVNNVLYPSLMDCKLGKTT